MTIGEDAMVKLQSPFHVKCVKFETKLHRLTQGCTQVEPSICQKFGNCSSSPSENKIACAPQATSESEVQIHIEKFEIIHNPLWN